MGKKHTFSLIELLIVISIFGVLISLLSPSLQSLTRSSEKIQCQKNLGRIAMAEQSHVEEYNSFFSPILYTHKSNLSNVWWQHNSKLTTYFVDGKLPFCPQVSENNSEKWYGRNLSSGSVFLTRDKAININHIEYPQAKVLMSDCTTNFLAAYSVSGSNGWLNTGEQSFRGAAFRHFNLANAAFFDGHVEALDLTEHLDQNIHKSKISYNKSELEKPFSY